MHCPACGAATYPEDAYCGACGAALAAPEPANLGAWCEIVLRRCLDPKFFGDEWEFVAIADDAAVVDQSEPFSANPVVLDADLTPHAETEAWKAFDHLQQRLTADGWSFIAAGTPWHRGRFTRDLNQPVQMPWRTPPPAPAPPAPPSRSPQPAASAPPYLTPPSTVAKHDLHHGVGYLLVGLIVTGGAFLLASAAGGGSFLVLWGAVAVGAFYLIRGVLRSGRD